MAHEFESGILFGQAAWHGLGTVVPADDPCRFDIACTLERSGANFGVEKVSLQTTDGVKTPFFATRRTDTGGILGMVKDRYTPLQTVNWFKPFIESREVAFETAIVLRGGSVVSVLAKLQRDNAVVTAGDEIAKYLLLASSHDGSLATNVGFTATRTVCMNTVQMALNSASSQLFKVRHTKSQNITLAAIRETINAIDGAFEATAKEYRKMAELKISQADLKKYVKLVLELPDDGEAIPKQSRDKMDRMIDLALNGAGNRDGLNAWTAYNGVTQYLTHEYGRNAENRFYANNFGVAQQMSARALKLAQSIAV
jgi:phage/plasmid-like protein (TIGR03299 family)